MRSLSREILAKTFLVFSSVVLLSQKCLADTGAAAAGPFQASFYSETIYDSRIEGAVTDSRLRGLYSLWDGTLKPFAGLHFSRDLSNGSAPQAIENAWSPALGVLYQFPRWATVLVEQRRLFRTHPQGRPNTIDELRYGLILYEKLLLKHHRFIEAYGEAIAIDRVSDDPVVAAWIKFGLEPDPQSLVKFTPYGEVFSRLSPDPGYGPTENEVRLGLKVSTSLGGLNLSALSHYAVFSDVKPGGLDFLLVLSGGYF